MVGGGVQGVQGRFLEQQPAPAVVAAEGHLEQPRPVPPPVGGLAEGGAGREQGAGVGGALAPENHSHASEATRGTRLHFTVRFFTTPRNTTVSPSTIGCRTTTTGSPGNQSPPPAGGW